MTPSQYRSHCRCVSRATGEELAAKRLSAVQVHSAPHLLRNEAAGLTQANARAVQRVVKLEETIECCSGDTLLVMEYASLAQSLCMHPFVSPPAVPWSKCNMFDKALHMQAGAGR